MRRVCIVVTTRGNFAKTKTAMKAILANPSLELQVVIGGALLNRQSAIVNEIERAGIEIADRLDYMLASETPEAISASAALCLAKATEIFTRLKPDVLLVIADRYEALALAQAALHANIRIAHLEGGEKSGSIDERIRHAITKLSHYHFPANRDAAERIVRLGEKPESVRVVGSPSFDLLKDETGDGLARLKSAVSASRDIDLGGRFLIVSQHPVVTEFSQAAGQYRTLFEALLRLALPAVLIWPNNDAGAGAIREPLEWLQSQKGCPPVAVVSGLPIEEYGAALKATACLVGNSSSGIREAAFLGTPAVNIGTRQADRGRSRNVLDVPCDANAIMAAVQRQIAHGRFEPDHSYGEGRSGQLIAGFLASYWPPLDKAISY